MNSDRAPVNAVVITGASTGIGLELARIYCNRFASARLDDCQIVIGIGRRPYDRINNAPFPASHYLCIDLEQADATLIIASFLRMLDVTTVLVLIHNAAVGWVGPIGQQHPQMIADMIAVNTLIPIAVTHALHNYLEKQSVVVFVSSPAARLPSPDYAAYAATKAAIEGFARSYRVEIDKGTAVTVVVPGPTQTEMHARSGLSPSITKNLALADPTEVAKKMVRAIDRRRRRSMIGATQHAIDAACRWFPRLIDRIMEGR